MLNSLDWGWTRPFRSYCLCRWLIMKPKVPTIAKNLQRGFVSQPERCLYLYRSEASNSARFSRLGRGESGAGLTHQT